MIKDFYTQSRAATIIIGAGLLCVLCGAGLMLKALFNTYALVDSCGKDALCNAHLYHNVDLVNLGNGFLFGGLAVAIIGGIVFRLSEIRTGKK